MRSARAGFERQVIQPLSVLLDCRRDIAHARTRSRAGRSRTLAAMRSSPRARSGLARGLTSWVRISVAAQYADQRARSALYDAARPVGLGRPGVTR